MKAGISRNEGRVSFFVLSDKMEMFEWSTLDCPGVSAAVRRAMIKAHEHPSNQSFCAALPTIEAFLLDSPDFLARRAGSRIQWQPSLHLEPPVSPQSFICVGLNYRDHVLEAGMTVPQEPLIFAKTGNALSGHNSTVRLPSDSVQVDYEAELAVVIGRECRNVLRDDALSFVAGYTCANDISARDFQLKEGQWYRGKSADGFGPLGPWIVTPREVGDPHHLKIKLRLNGNTLQNSSTQNLIIGIPDLISYISRTITLAAGDVILTGTPSGVGYKRKPPIFLNSGDRVEVEIERIGTLINTMQRE